MRSSRNNNNNIRIARTRVCVHGATVGPSTIHDTTQEDAPARPRQPQVGCISASSGPGPALLDPSAAVAPTSATAVSARALSNDNSGPGTPRVVPVRTVVIVVYADAAAAAVVVAAASEDCRRYTVTPRDFGARPRTGRPSVSFVPVAFASLIV